MCVGGGGGAGCYVVLSILCSFAFISLMKRGLAALL